ncbi:MAG: hypothetical protein ACRDWW_08540 [Acidimicrobiales bacterium]
MSDLGQRTDQQRTDQQRTDQQSPTAPVCPVIHVEPVCPVGHATPAASAPPRESACPMAGPRRPGRGYFIPGVVALAALLAIGAGLGAGELTHAAPTELQGSVIASDIAAAVQTQSGSRTGPVVSCPSEPVRQGLRFYCSIAGGGERPAALEVTEVDSSGHLRWSLPRATTQTQR